MPRTKKPVIIQKPKNKTKDNLLNNQRALFDQLTLREVHEREIKTLVKYEDTITTINMLFSGLTLRLNKEILVMPFEKLLADNFDIKKLNEVDVFSKFCQIKIDEKEDKTFTIVRRSKRTKNKTFVVPPAPATFQHFMTPAANKLGKLNPITPKIEPNTALTVLRHPRHGEIGISINGSPLLVSSNHNHELANVNFPLQDGNIISIIGQQGNNNFKNVSVDNKTKEQLKIIQRNLDIILEENED